MEQTETPLPAPLRAVRSVARGILGDDYWRVQVGLTERTVARNWRRSPLRPVTEAYVRRYGLTVRSGPFAGMQYPPAAVGFAEAIVAKLLGAYERELYPAVEAALGEEHDALVNVGCADGLFATGCARRDPALAVHAFDVSPTARRICRAVARHNGVLDRFTIYGLADVEALRSLPVRRPLAVVDCEGAEIELLDPERVPWLRDATVLLELHDFMAPGATEIVTGRFATTHDVEVIAAEPRYLVEYPEVRELPLAPVEQELAIQEFRPAPMQWAVMRPQRA